MTITNSRKQRTMNKYFLFLIIVSIGGIFSNYAHTNDITRNARLYAVKSGVLETQIKQKTYDKVTMIREVRIWDDWGLKAAKYQLLPNGEGTKSITFYKETDGRLILDKAYLVQLKDMSYKQVPTLAQPSLKKLNKEQQRNTTESLMMLGGHTKSGKTREWKEYKCDVWLHPIGNKNCLWRGIIFYTDMSAGDFYKSTKTPVSFFEGDIIDQAHFDVPGLSSPD